jgi:predicted nucleic acid-binding protein
MVWEPIAADQQTIGLAWNLQNRYKLSFWDALIVAAARSAECGYLLTENLQASQDMEGILVVNPFRTEPAHSVDGGRRFVGDCCDKL